MSLTVESPSVAESEDYITAEYKHQTSRVSVQNGKVRATLEQSLWSFRTQRKAGRVGLLLVGFGGNNGSTLLGGLLANRHKLAWMTKRGVQNANFLGSITQCASMKVGEDEIGEVFMRLRQVVPIAEPTELVVGGWDINGANLAESMRRAQVFDYDLQQQLLPYMREYKPWPSVYYPSFIAGNQESRADNLLPGNDKNAHLLALRANISSFKQEHSLDRIIVLWTANTERLVAQLIGVNDTYDNLVQAVRNNHTEVPPSALFALAAAQQGCAFINGSPQNTFVGGVRQAATRHGTLLVGDDFKTGQTKFKTSFVEFLTGAGIKPKSCVSYNHLGNNDGKNLSSQAQFKSKEASKSECIRDLLDNSLLYGRGQQQPDHTVVIKYVPSAGDSKKAIDEYTSEIFMGGQHTFVAYNVCEDSLLAAGVMLDLILLSELLNRVTYRKVGGDWSSLKGLVPFLGYLTKAPQCEGPIINSLPRQRACIQNLIRALTGLPLEDSLLLNYRLQ